MFELFIMNYSLEKKRTCTNYIDKMILFN